MAGVVVQLRGKVVVITGGARGIGAALATRFAAEGAAGIVLADVNGEQAERTAAVIAASGTRAVGTRTDVTDDGQMRDLVALAEREFGPVDLFCSNAGVANNDSLDPPDELWASSWAVNVMGHVHGVRAVLPSMLDRGSGYLLNTVSAAGLLTCPGNAPYSATKHAALGYAEWLAMTYGNLGIKVSALCPMGVRTEMLVPGIEAGNASAVAVASASGELLDPARVADDVVAGLADERFLILPHAHVGPMYAARAADPDRWLGGMRHVYGERTREPNTIAR